MQTVNFSRNFIRLRKSKGFTQEQVAEIFGVSRQAITKWEIGSSMPDLIMIASICNEFSVTSDELLFLDYSQKKRESNADTKIMEKLDEVLKAIKVNGRMKNMNLYEEYEYYQEDPEDSDLIYEIGCEEASKGNLDEALALMDEAISRGNIFAIKAAINLYMEIIDIYCVDEDGCEGDYWEMQREFGKKLQIYGKILTDVVRQKVLE